MSGQQGLWNKFNILIAKCCWAIIHWTSKNIQTRSSKIPDLCPTDEAENAEVYIDRLEEMLEKRSDTVREIAITAPYSGGKSSLINTFIKRYPNNKYTCISLAAFKDTYAPEDNSGVVMPDDYDHATNTKIATKSNNEHLYKIEKSIVQQILYRSDGSKIPDSKLGEIYFSIKSYFHALMTASTSISWLIILGAIVYVPDFKIGISFNNIISNHNLTNINLWIFSYFVSFPIIVFKDGYKHLHKHKITKLNPFKGEVVLEPQEKDSTFNTYLEEIIFYFETTKSNVVIFEDLDRFERTDIFIKLKELNKLINDCADVKQNVSFIYALRDDVFEGKNRTKFFDAIIPVIPIINTANSYPQIKKLLTQAELNTDLSDSYLRDISVYIDDMRILKNIIAEYSIYKNTLTIDLNFEKLFSFMLYKNIYCDDFAKLHDHEGVLAELFKNTRKIKQSRVKELTAQIKSYEQQLIDSECELTSSMLELNSHYLLKIMEKTGNHQGIIHINRTSIYEIPKQEVFDKLSQNNNHFNYNTQNSGLQNSRLSFNCYKDEMVPSYSIRKKRILDKGNDRQQKLKTETQNLTKKLDSNNNLSLRELASGLEREQVFKGVKDKALLIHMVEKGYIDKDYYIYMSHFIEGGMTKNDMNFVMSVKDNKPLDRSMSIDNLEETLKFLSTYDEFKNIAFFNYNVVDYYISNNNYYPLSVLIKEGIKESNDSLLLIEDSFSQIQEKSLWLKSLCSEWSDIWTDIITTSEVASLNKNGLLVKMLVEVDIDDGKYQLEKNTAFLCNYISGNEYISEYFPVKDDIREKLFLVFDFLGVNFQTLSGCKDETIFLRYVLKHQMFDINIENLIIILSSIQIDGGEDSLNYSYLLLIENIDFSKLMNSKINDIAHLIAIGHITTTQEQEIIDLLNNQDIDLSVKQDIIHNVDFKLSNLKWLKKDNELILLLENNRVQPNWLNTIFLHNNKETDESCLINFISDTENAEKLCEQDNELSDDNANDFYYYIIKDNISLDTFKKYNSYFGFTYPAHAFENISKDKLRYLIENSHLSINLKSYDSLRSINCRLSSLFLGKNFSDFVEGGQLSSEVSIESDDFYSLLEMKSLSRDQKICLINSRSILIEPSLNNEDLIDHLLPSSFVSEYKPDSSIPEIPIDKLIALLEQLNNDDKRKEVFTWQLQYLDVSNITSILRILDNDFLKLPDAKSYIYVGNTPINEALSKSLKYHDYISSITTSSNNLLGKQNIKINVKRN